MRPVLYPPTPCRDHPTFLTARCSLSGTDASLPLYAAAGSRTRVERRRPLPEPPDEFTVVQKERKDWS